MSHLGDELSAYLDNEIDATARDRIAEHLTGCEACRDELADIDLARQVVRRLPQVELPARTRRLTGFRPRRSTGFWPRWAWVAPALAATVLAAGLLVAPGQGDPQFDMGSLVDQHVARVVLDPGISTIRGPVSGP